MRSAIDDKGDEIQKLREDVKELREEIALLQASNTTLQEIVNAALKEYFFGESAGGDPALEEHENQSMMYQDFFNQYNGKPVETEDPSNRDQCMDLAFAWCDALGIPRETIRHLYAYQVFTEPNDATRQHFQLIPNTPDGVPEQGDLIVFSTVVGPAGHICIATGTGDANTFQSFDQNWNGHAYTETVGHSYNGVLGWLRSEDTGSDGDDHPGRA